MRLWDALTGTHKRTLEGHTSSVYSVAFSPDSRTLASGSSDHTVRLWDALTGAHKRTLEGHTARVSSVAFSPDGRTLASGSWDNTVRIWDALTGAHKRTLEGHTDSVSSVAFSPDGRTLASAGGWEDNTVRLWDALTGTHKRTLEGHTSSVYSVAFSPDSRTLASGSSDHTVRLWDALTGAHKRTLAGHTDGVNSVAFSPDGRTLASGSTDDTVRLWDAVTGAHERTLKGHTGYVRSVAFSPDGRTLASGSYDDTVRLWDALTGAHRRTLEGHTGVVWSVAFSPDGRTLASGSGWDDDTVRLWDVLTSAHKWTLEGHTYRVDSVAFSPDSRTLASGSGDGTVLLWGLTPSATANAVVNMSPSSVASPAIGERFTFSLDIKDGENVAGYQATVEIDTSALRYVDSANGDYLPDGAFDVPAIVDANRVTLAATALAGESDGDGTLATLTFEVIAVKPSTVRLSDVVLSDSAGAASRPQLENAHVVESPQVAGDVNGDGTVNIQDLVLVAGQLGQAGQNDADVNGDGVVNIQDLVLVAGALGNAAAPSSRDVAVALTRADVKAWLAQAERLPLTDAISLRGVRFLENLLEGLTPRETALLPNYPNPFNPETWIPYRLANNTDVQISIYDTKGELVRGLDLGHQPAGYYTDRSRAAYWDGRNDGGELVSSGLYYYQLRAGVFSEVRRMVIVK